MLIRKVSHFSLPNPPPLATAIEPVDPEFTELLRRDEGDDSPSPWGELYLMLTMVGAGFFGEGPKRLLKLIQHIMFVTLDFRYAQVWKISESWILKTNELHTISKWMISSFVAVRGFSPLMP